MESSSRIKQLTVLFWFIFFFRTCKHIHLNKTYRQFLCLVYVLKCHCFLNLNLFALALNKLKAVKKFQNFRILCLMSYLSYKLSSVQLNPSVSVLYQILKFLEANNGDWKYIYKHQVTTLLLTNLAISKQTDRRAKNCICCIQFKQALWLFKHQKPNMLSYKTTQCTFFQDW